MIKYKDFKNFLLFNGVSMSFFQDIVITNDNFNNEYTWIRWKDIKGLRELETPSSKAPVFGFQADPKNKTITKIAFVGMRPGRFPFDASKSTLAVTDQLQCAGWLYLMTGSRLTVNKNCGSWVMNNQRFLPGSIRGRNYELVADNVCTPTMEAVQEKWTRMMGTFQILHSICASDVAKAYRAERKALHAMYQEFQRRSAAAYRSIRGKDNVRKDITKFTLMLGNTLSSASLQ